MCGFIGVIGRGAELERGLSSLRRRGPDSQHLWSSVDGNVKLLHCRLAIVDTDPRADQPFNDKKRRIAIALNGEIYNYRQLRNELSDYDFQSQSDTEVVIAAYALHGIAGFAKLNGMFSFVLVDEQQRRILLVRDAVGKKPLFIYRDKERVLFGSSVLALAACSLKPELDPNVAAFYWNRAYISPDQSILFGARPVKPGEVIEFNWSGAQLQCQRCEPAPTLLYNGESHADVRSNISALVSEAIDRRLENNETPVTLLSGGIDSTVVSLFARDRIRSTKRASPLKVLTLGALVPYTQDELYARYAAHRMGLRLQIVSLGRSRLIDAITRAISVQDEPLGMPSYFYLHQMVQAAACHGRVLLTGDGGDEVFLGYRPPREWRSHDLPSGDEPPFVKVGPGPSEWMGTWARDVTGNTLLGHMFAKSDRASAEQGVEIRCPLLDPGLMSYIRSLPFDIVAGSDETKPLLKNQLSYPNWFVARRKLGFAYNLRWRWALTRFEGLRDLIMDEAIETFSHLSSGELRRPARYWSTASILNNFGEAWRLFVWSAFLERFSSIARRTQS